MDRPNVHVVGWGHALPQRIVTNAELADFLETTDKWIDSRTGIRARRIAQDHENTSSLAALAVERAMDRAGLEASEVDAIICATSSPDCLTPATACLVQDLIGARSAFAFDISAGCTGFLYGLRTAQALMRDGAVETVAVVGAETMSRVLDWSDRTTSVLMGDGAGAVILRADEAPGGLLECSLASDGSGASLISIGIGTRQQHVRGAPVVGRQPHMEMQGAQVYAFAARVVTKSVREIVAASGATLDDIDLIIPHQANERISRSAAARLGLAPDRMYSNIARYGNTAAASIPIALSEAADEGAIALGDQVVLVGFGSGLTWAAAMLEWTAPVPSACLVRMPSRGIRREREESAHRSTVYS